MNLTSRRALAALTAAGLLWGLTVPLSKLALGWLGPGWLTVVRFALAGVLLVILARPGVRAACTPAVLAWGAIGYGGSVFVQNIGIAQTSVSHAALLVGATPVLVAIIAAVWLRSVATKVAWAGMALSLGGVAVIAGSGGVGATRLGDALVILSLVLSAAFAVAQAGLLRGRDPIAVTAAQFLAAAVASLPVAALTETFPTAPADAGPALATVTLVIAGTLVPFTLFAYGQSRVRPEVAGAFINLEPVVGVVVGAALFAEPIGMLQITGGAAILLGIALSSLPAPQRRRAPHSAEVAAQPGDDTPVWRSHGHATRRAHASSRLVRPVSRAVRPVSRAVRPVARAVRRPRPRSCSPAKDLLSS